ncbi:MAG: DUF5602 domain-containing protein [Gammaproteobacteria bacterium]|nr:DUF5602 domain-containing protein [Pseudomonadales bacterium]MCP5345371.1 DUF5602 domain-containing protein [Pseudomonadales bacterium]
MQSIKNYSLLYSVLLCLAGPAGNLAAEELPGDCAALFGANVCTWTINEAGRLTALGVEIPLAAIESAPATTEMTWPPATAAAIHYPQPVQAATGLQHMTINWESMGHPPLPFLTPHFDFHFYLTDPEQRTAIDCLNNRKPELMPPGYGLPDLALPPEMAALTGTDELIGVCVPQMGMHAFRLSETEGTEPFSATLLIGYYDGNPLFFEPMVSRAFLLGRHSFSLEIPPVPGLDRQPSRFDARYDSGRDAYRFLLSGFQH